MQPTVVRLPEELYEVIESIAVKVSDDADAGR
jgi:hypothetical protein